MLGRASVPAVRVLRLDRWHILHQLWLEEALMYHTNQNWVVLNHGPQKPTVVMGISGKENELLNEANVQRDKISVLRRFTGGGTVVVDPATAFVSFVFNNEDADEHTRPYPREIMKWSEDVYLPVFDSLMGGASTFRHLENDYIIHDRKIGGNAQAISKNRWIHHTSFLIDFDDGHMNNYLAMPKKRPDYRKDREHGEFMVRLKEYNISHEKLFGTLITELAKRYETEEATMVDVQNLLAPLGGFAAWTAKCRTKILQLGNDLENEPLPLPTIEQAAMIA